MTYEEIKKFVKEHGWELEKVVSHGNPIIDVVYMSKDLGNRFRLEARVEDGRYKDAVGSTVDLLRRREDSTGSDLLVWDHKVLTHADIARVPLRPVLEMFFGEFDVSVLAKIGKKKVDELILEEEDRHAKSIQKLNSEVKALNKLGEQEG